MSECAVGNSGPLQADVVRSLLIEMLRCVRHSQDTPLYFGVDGHRIAQAALAKWPSSSATPEVMARIDELVRQALGMPGIGSQDGESVPQGDALQSLLGEWMLSTHEKLRAVHPMALDILGLLVEGETPREIAQRLDFGLRLTNRIAADMRGAWPGGRHAVAAD